MSKELIEKKIEQIRILINELRALLQKPEIEFIKDAITLRAAERDFQLIVDLASDINTHILLEGGKRTPDSYRQSFLDLKTENIIEAGLAETLALSARLRNILVHEYDFDEDYAKFYQGAKRFLPAYDTYVGLVLGYLKNRQ